MPLLPATCSNGGSPESAAASSRTGGVLGKGAGRKRGSGKEGREVRRVKDRAHSFHGKADRQRGPRGPGRDCTCEEKVVQGARSILLTEENLVPIRSAAGNCCRAALCPVP